MKAEQAATEISLTQPAEEGLPIGRSRKYREHGKRLVTMKEKYEVGDYTLKLSAVGCHSTVWLKYCVTIVLKYPFKIVNKIRHAHILLGGMGLDKMA